MPVQPSIMEELRKAYLQTFLIREGSELRRSANQIELITPNANERWFNRMIYSHCDIKQMNSLVESRAETAFKVGSDYEWVLWPDQHPDFQQSKSILEKNGFKKMEVSDCLSCDSYRFESIKQNSEVILRRAEITDLDLYVKTFVQGWDSRQINPLDCYNRISSQLSSNRFYLVYLGEQLVGTCELQLLKSSAYLGGSSVIPEMRGKGIYSQMVRNRLQIASQSGLNLCTSIGLIGSSSPLLQRFGFQSNGTVDFHALFVPGGASL